MRQLFILALIFPLATAYFFDCLDGCECDTEDEIIHCHNGNRKQLILPKGSRLRGFPVIALPYNDIKNLPNEETLLNKFPDLKVIDVERNPNFDCDSLTNYDKVKIISDCFKNATEVDQVPKIMRPTRNCDLTCQANKHYEKLHEYVLHLWEIIKQKYNDFDYDDTMRSIKQFFTMTIEKIKKLGSDIKDIYHSAVSEWNKPADGSISSSATTASPYGKYVDID
ncbi:hypothetical protein WR25_13060 [Diploscapter pachys]|uniref:LRRNT domain-containing protein n=1 Tax=Diploscapter pachys TaxID=2018661 RepID=A0A2A2J2H2_9BILA|nr:hypothetical protein WR25_13060 [Diploscapter pachys]